MDEGSLSLPILVVVAFVAILAGVTILAIRIYRNHRRENVTEEDIRTMVSEGQEQGVLESGEAEMISNIFEMSDKQAWDIMTNRKNIVAIDGSQTLKEAADFMLKECSNSRFPVYGQDLDDILGTVHLRELLILSRRRAIYLLCLRTCSRRRFTWRLWWMSTDRLPVL